MFDGFATALAVGLTTGGMDAATDYYGDKIVDTQLGKPPRGGGGAESDDALVRRVGEAEELGVRSHEPSELERVRDYLDRVRQDIQLHGGAMRLGRRQQVRA